MKARAAVEVTREDGHNRIGKLRSDPPLTLRRTTGDDDAACVHLVSSAAGPLCGDDLAVAVIVHDDAALRLRGLGAMLALPGAGTVRRIPATLATTVDVAAGADLDARMPPVILANGSLLHATTTIRLARDSTLRWTETTALGRHGENGGGAIFDLRVHRDDRPLLISSTDLTDSGLRRSPAVLGDARAIGQALLVAPGLRRPADSLAVRGAGACWSTIHELDGALLITVLGPDLRLVANELDSWLERSPFR
jgi:urease accessory protein